MTRFPGPQLRGLATLSPEDEARIAQETEAEIEAMRQEIVARMAAERIPWRGPYQPGAAAHGIEPAVTQGMMREIQTAPVAQGPGWEQMGSDAAAARVLAEAEIKRQGMIRENLLAAQAPDPKTGVRPGEHRWAGIGDPEFDIPRYTAYQRGRREKAAMDLVPEPSQYYSPHEPGSVESALAKARQREIWAGLRGEEVAVDPQKRLAAAGKARKQKRKEGLSRRLAKVRGITPYQMEAEQRLLSDEPLSTVDKIAAIAAAPGAGGIPAAEAVGAMSEEALDVLRTQAIAQALAGREGSAAEIRALLSEEGGLQEDAGPYAKVHARMLNQPELAKQFAEAVDRREEDTVASLMKMAGVDEELATEFLRAMTGRSDVSYEHPAGMWPWQRATKRFQPTEEPALSEEEFQGRMGRLEAPVKKKAGWSLPSFSFGGGTF